MTVTAQKPRAPPNKGRLCGRLALGLARRGRTPYPQPGPGPASLPTSGAGRQGGSGSDRAEARHERGEMGEGRRGRREMQVTNGARLGGGALPVGPRAAGSDGSPSP